MTRKIKVLVGCLIVAIAATAAISAIASAAMTLPIFSLTDPKATGESGKGTLSIEGGASIRCETSGSDELTFETGKRNLGPGTIIFKSCTQGGEECHSLGGTGGTIETTGSWHLVLNGKTEATDIHLFLFLLTLLHIECPKAAVKLLIVLGNVAGKIVQKAGSKTQFVLEVGTVNKEGKVQNFSEYENDAGTGIKTTLQVLQEGGTKPKFAGEESESNILTFTEVTSIEK
jgi:hypothetical protein